MRATSRWRDASAAGGGRGVAQGPVHAADLAALARDHDLDGPARSVLAAQIDAFLDLQMVFVRLEVPHVLVGQDQRDAAAVGLARRLDARMQVETHREG